MFEGEKGENIIIGIGAAVAMFLIAFPAIERIRSKSKGGSAVSAPKSGSKKSKLSQKENAPIVLDALRLAYANGETQDAITKMRKEIYDDYGLKVMQRGDTKQFYVVNDNGDVLHST